MTTHYHHNHDPFEFDLGDDLVISKISPRQQDSATWVRGTLAGHAFDALVFPAHAENEGYELGTSRISKLFLRREADRQVVYNWDRGLDIAAANDLAQAIVDFLAAGLAEHIDNIRC